MKDAQPSATDHIRLAGTPPSQARISDPSAKESTRSTRLPNSRLALGGPRALGLGVGRRVGPLSTPRFSTRDGGAPRPVGWRAPERSPTCAALAESEACDPEGSVRSVLPSPWARQSSARSHSRHTWATRGPRWPYEPRATGDIPEDLDTVLLPVYLRDKDSHPDESFVAVFRRREDLARVRVVDPARPRRVS
jgi:hypothetical protein